MEQQKEGKEDWLIEIIKQTSLTTCQFNCLHEVNGISYLSGSYALKKLADAIRKALRKRIMRLEKMGTGYLIRYYDVLKAIGKGK